MSVYSDENTFKIQIQLRIKWAVDRTHLQPIELTQLMILMLVRFFIFQSKSRNKNEAHLVQSVPNEPWWHSSPKLCEPLCSWDGILLNYLLVGHCYTLFWVQVTIVSLASLSYKSLEQLEPVQLRASNPYLCRTDSQRGNCKIHCLMQFTDHLERWFMEL